MKYCGADYKTMANSLGIVHPGMLGSLATTFYTSACTIEVATESRTALGEVTRTWANLTGHVNLACSLTVPLALRSGETETGEQIFVRRDKRLAFSGAYTSITEKHRAVVDGVTYDIESVTIDSQGKTTHLGLELIL